MIRMAFKSADAGDEAKMNEFIATAQKRGYQLKPVTARWLKLRLDAAKAKAPAVTTLPIRRRRPEGDGTAQ